MGICKRKVEDSDSVKRAPGRGPGKGASAQDGAGCKGGKGGKGKGGKGKGGKGGKGKGQGLGGDNGKGGDGGGGDAGGARDGPKVYKGF